MPRAPFQFKEEPTKRIVIAVAGDAETGAAAGATAGAVKGRRQQKAAGKQADEKAKSDQAAAAAGPKEQYRKAFQTCLQGKGYTVN